MMILITTDETIDHPEDVSHRMDAVCRSALHPFRDRIDRVEIRLRSGPAPDAKDREWRCEIRAHGVGRNPLLVFNRSRTVHEAYEGAARELRSLLGAENGPMPDARPSVGV